MKIHLRSYRTNSSWIVRNAWQKCENGSFRRSRVKLQICHCEIVTYIYIYILYPRNNTCKYLMYDKYERNSLHDSMHPTSTFTHNHTKLCKINIAVTSEKSLTFTKIITQIFHTPRLLIKMLLSTRSIDEVKLQRLEGVGKITTIRLVDETRSRSKPRSKRKEIRGGSRSRVISGEWGSGVGGGCFVGRSFWRG